MFEYFSADERVTRPWASSDIPIVNLNRAKKWKTEPVVSCIAAHFSVTIFRLSEQIRDGNLIMLLYRRGDGAVR